MAAFRPCVFSTARPQGGPALRVRLVSELPPGAVALGGAAQPIYVVSAEELAQGWPVQGNVAPVPVLLVADGRPVAGGAPIPVVVEEE